MKVIMHLMGGLGNQMFQYALGRKIVDDCPQNAVLKYHFEDSYKMASRKYSLHQFKLSIPKASFADLYNIGPERNISRQIRLSLNLPIEKKVIREKRIYGFDKSILSQQDDCYLIGFWQSYKYFESIRSVLLHDFTLRSPSTLFMNALAEIREAECSISIHIRRTDYLNKASGFTSLGLDYYTRSLSLIGKQVTTFQLFIFTDDVSWVLTNFVNKIGIGNRVTIVSQPDISDAEELTLMSCCHHQIIANSSFSWWAAWINTHPGKIILYPTQWVNDEAYNTDNLIPDGWIKI